MRSTAALGQHPDLDSPNNQTIVIGSPREARTRFFWPVRSTADFRQHPDSFFVWSENILTRVAPLGAVKVRGLLLVLP